MRTRERFRELLRADRCVPAAPVFDPMSARIAEITGWEACKLSGSCAKAAAFGAPDGTSAVTTFDMAEICSRILKVSDVCLIVDGDDGGRTPDEVRRTVQEFEAAGVAAIEIEDRSRPMSVFEFESYRPLHSMSSQVRRLEAAAAARRERSTVIVARTGALRDLPLPAALDRIRRYSQTGSEALMLTGPRTIEELEAVHAVTELPIFVSSGLPREAIDDDAILRANNVRIRYHEFVPFRMAVQALYEAFTILRSDGLLPPKEQDRRQASAGLIAEITHQAAVMEWEKRYQDSS